MKQTKTNQKLLHNVYLDIFLEEIKKSAHQKFIAFSWRWKEDLWYSFIIRKLELDFDLNNANLFYLNPKIQDNIKTDSVIDLGNLYVFKQEDFVKIQDKIHHKDFLNPKLQSKFFHFAKKVIQSKKINIFFVSFDSITQSFQSKILYLENQDNTFFFNKRLKEKIKTSPFLKNKIFEESSLLFKKEQSIKNNILQKDKQKAYLIMKQFFDTLESLDYETHFKNRANKFWNNKQAKLIDKAKILYGKKSK
ncbi:hypothetical protein [Mesomycoplasma hyorhinis]|uniref:hypothetical protein n=1 Tax=Mesomycoplasma hyorhinis TaxID=2100 RepID=UPI00136908CF|nr:hypothetical protein [Mesomycoplasma hyorhinis]MXR11574.1 hypothetical protein [Mesomycoplasma hyorhinis]MXR38768.1 hypothetical protein [Mesomycoplasma hyorhinis]MXR58067.1 hypothetical protein [Mesomycoplasma hyorhinis]